MPAVDIESVSVEFPFQPYTAQVTYMEKVVEALNKRTNALLESPTGTGKTLSLLCSTLAWQQSYSPDKDNAGFAAAGGCCGGGGGGSGGAKAPSNGGGIALRYESDSTALSRPSQTNGGGGLKAGLGFLPGPQGKPVIVYASRTHSQLTQVVRELKATTYRPRTVILGSREQLCVHPEVSKLKGGLQNRRCGVLVGNRSCRYKNNLESFQVEQAGGLGGPGVMDIEELSELGRTKLICPYYLMRQNTLQADLVLMPYNYLLDAGSRQPYQVRWPNSIIIFDEAHNLESVASEAWSLELSTTMTARVSDELEKAWELLKAEGEQEGGKEGGGGGGGMYATPPPTMEDLIWLKTAFTALEEGLDDVQLTAAGGGGAGGGGSGGGGRGGASSFPSSHPPLKSATLGPQKLQELLQEAGLSGLLPQDYAAVVSRMERTINFLMDAAMNGGGRGGGGGREGGMGGMVTLFSGGALDAFLKAYKMIYFWGNTTAMRKNMQAYRVYIQSGGGRAPSSSNRGGGGGGGGGGRRVSGEGRVSFPPPADDPPRRVLHYWCFCPGIALEQLLELSVRSVLLTSGTLSPLDSYASELRIPFPVRLENGHVITAREQAFIATLGVGPRGEMLSSSFQRRGEEGYVSDLGESLIRMARVVPGGMLVFFPSYGVMDQCVRRWRGREEGGGGVLQRLRQVKVVVEEPRKAGELQACMLAYDSAIKEQGGAVLLAVCRGKVSEGMDFADNRARAVIITGIPFPPARDPRVELKKKYLDTVVASSPSPSSFPSSTSSSSSSSSSQLKGMEWYMQQAARAVNQAVGRVIRHRNDYGVVLLLDERFASSSQLSSLSKWARPHVQGCSSFEGAMEGVSKFFARVKTIPRLVPRKRMGAGARAPENHEEFEEEEEDLVVEDREAGRVGGRKGAGFRYRRGAVVVNADMLEMDAGYIAPDVIERELPSLSQGGREGGREGQEEALNKFLEFKCALREQQRLGKANGGKPLGSRPSTLSSLFAQKDVLVGNNGSSSSNSSSMDAATGRSGTKPSEIRRGGGGGAAAAAAAAATAAAGKSVLVRKGSLSEQLGLVPASSAPCSFSSSSAFSASASASSSSSLKLALVFGNNTNSRSSSSDGGGGGRGVGGVGKQNSSSQPNSLPSSFPSHFVPPPPLPRKLSALSRSLSAMGTTSGGEAGEGGGGRGSGGGSGSSSVDFFEQKQVQQQRKAERVGVGLSGSISSLPSFKSSSLSRSQSSASSPSSDYSSSARLSVPSSSLRRAMNQQQQRQPEHKRAATEQEGDDEMESEGENEKLLLEVGDTDEDECENGRQGAGGARGRDEGLDMQEIQQWLESAKVKLTPERLALLNDRIKEVLKGKIRTLKDFQAWSSAGKGGAVDVFLSTGADPSFLSRFAYSFLPSFLRPVFDGMIKTRFRPPSRHPLARAGAGATTAAAAASAAAMAAAVVAKQEAGKGKAFYAPGAEEDYLIRRSVKRSKTTAGQEEGESGRLGGKAGGERDENKDRNVIERLQHLVDRGLGDAKEATKKREDGDEGRGSNSGRQQKCLICDETLAVFMSPCGHIACMSCWKRWLNRKTAPGGGARSSSICFYKCGPVTLHSLKRVLAGIMKAPPLPVAKQEGGTEEKKAASLLSSFQS